MIVSWLVFLFLALLAAGFMLWPVVRARAIADQAAAEAQAHGDHLRTNIQLFQEQMAELEAALAEGRIDSEQFAQLKLEQERNLLEDEAGLEAYTRKGDIKRGVVILVLAGLVMVVLAVGLYQQWGAAPDVAIQQLQLRNNQLALEDLNNNREPDAGRTLELMAALEARLEQQPQNTQYWFLLARTAMEAGDFSRAVTAYEKILPLDPEASVVMGELAQALFLRDKNRMSPEVAQLAQATLKLDPQNTTALGLAGIEAFERKDFSAAADYWQRAVTVIGPEAPASRPLLSGIKRARAEAAAAGEVPDEAEAARRIPVRVQLGAGLEGLSKDLPVFIYARAWQGSRMPLAIQRLTLADLPATLVLDESMAMSPALSLAQAAQVELIARIALDGSATAKPGDWQGAIGPIEVDRVPADLVIVIDQKINE